MYTAEDVLKIARAEIGYKEKKSNAQLDDPTANAGPGNFTKYSRDLYSAGYYGGHSKQGFAWCCCFYDWCHWVASGKDRELAQSVTCQSGIYGAACNYSANYYRAKNRFDQTPSVGAQVYFGSDGFEHTGIVERFDDTYIYTIEGNTSDGVGSKQYKRTNARIKGYGHPFYDGDEYQADIPASESIPRTDSTIVKVNAFVLRKGSKGKAVETLQILLNHELDCELEVDGAFGNYTLSAVKQYQQENSLSVDGVVGEKTWTSIINN